MTVYQRRKLNGLLHELIVLRDGGKCLYCGRTDTLQVSHIYPKGIYRGLEFDPLNLKLLCYRHHFHWWHKHPLEAKPWLEKVIDKKRLAYLKKKSLQIIKNQSYEKIKTELEREIRNLKSQL